VRFSVPHPIPYQGSKRRLAAAILSHVEAGRYERLIEPFAGSAAVTLAAARSMKFRRFEIGDRLEPLVMLWQAIIDDPERIANEYESLWTRERKRPIDEFYDIRSQFNDDSDPAKLLYLLARCVKNAVRFNPSGEFNQSPDKRRTGTRPDAMRRELLAAHRLLHGKARTVCADFLEVFETAGPGDFFYLDPPYQGTSDGRDSRYIGGVTRTRMIEGLNVLNRRGIPFILSYDGSCGDRTYGDRLPRELASRILLDVGRSSQATLNGQDHVTIESLYISHNLIPATADDRTMGLHEFDEQLSMTQSLF
jgi:DNA adenine methylase